MASNSIETNKQQSQAEDFLKAIFSQLAGGFLEIRAFPGPKQYFFSIPSELNKAAALAISLKNQVYYSAAPRTQQKGTADAVSTMPDLWVDGDDGALPWVSLALTPSIVVNTGNVAGNHYQAHYLLDPPLELKAESDRDKAVAYLKALSTVLKGDPSSCDIARILRVPGTFNTKDASHPGLCHIVELHPDARHSIEQIRGRITITFILRHWEKGQQQDLALSLAGYLAKWGVPQGGAETLLLSLLDMTGHEEPKARLSALVASYQKLAKGQGVEGYTRLEEYLGKDELAALDNLWREFTEERGKARTRRAEGAKKRPEQSDEINRLAVKQVIKNCAFVQHCRDQATTLQERRWWSMVHILVVFGEAGRESIHELSQPYPNYSESETEQKIEQALKAGEKEIGPHTCLFIEQDLGFDCPGNCLAKKLAVASPSGLGAKLATQVLQYGEPIKEEPEEQAGLPPTPELPEDVWQGLFRDYRDLVAGTTEAPDNYHYVCFAQTLGATLGRRTHVYHARRLFPNFYICLVGRTAITRKDTARYRAQRLLNDLHSEENPEDPQFQILPGIGSAEGLLDALGGERKVVVLSESELLSLLAKARQEALSNLIPKLTSLFDCPDLETLKTRQRTVVCKEPFLSISSGTTLAWLQRALTEKDIYGGFANRFIFVYGNPKPPMPFPPKVDPAAHTALLTKINEMRLWAEHLQRSEAGGELAVPDTTRSMFADFYAEYHKRCAAETLPATLIPRVQTFVWKLGLLYAAMAASEQILPEHLEPAIIAGNYFEQSVLQIFRTFGASRGKEVEDKLLTFLQSKGRGTPIPQREVYRALNLSAAELEQAAKPLERLGLIRNSTRVTERGRRILCYEAL